MKYLYMRPSSKDWQKLLGGFEVVLDLPLVNSISCQAYRLWLGLLWSGELICNEGPHRRETEKAGSEDIAGIGDFAAIAI